MSDGILYYVIGEKHVVQLCVSLYTLRQHWHGPVAVLIDDASRPYVQRMADDERLGEIAILTHDWPSGPRGTGYANKTLLVGLSPFERTIYVDADTLFVADPQPLFPESEHFTLTSFSDWPTNGRRMKHRLEKWRDFAREEVTLMRGHPYPALNTGVFAWISGTEAIDFAKAWREMTLRNVLFICDEIACQLMFWRNTHKIVDDSWNWSPINGRVNHRHGRPVVPRIVHCHGGKGIKRAAGRAWWWQPYERCLEENIACLPEWTPAKCRELRQFLADPSVYP
jgi:hypothetical protein